MYNSVFIKELTKHEPALLAFAIQLTRDSYLAKDLVQDTYINALLYQHSYKPNKLLKSWLFSILKHRFVNDYHIANKIRNVFDSTKDIYNLEIMDYNLSPDLPMDIKDLHKVINGITNSSFKEVLLLHIAGYKDTEIAIKLTMPINTVRTKLWNIRKQLVKKIKANEYK